MMKCHIRVEVTHWIARRLPLPIMCEFSFDPGDPLAVTLIFDSEGEYPVRWVFARDLLTEGLTARSGRGDVELWPVHSDGRRFLWIQVGNACAGRTALFEMPAQPVAQWLAGCYDLVPRGAETAGVDWSELTQLIQ
ncbi:MULTISPECIES: SsgA family sporulation/cell division regulator [Streptomyces]|uniref:Sporulation-specific cell division protein SsgB n=1 Tax=Streptomyces canarius TaxID=285453 RepID=A0ABQ3DBI4_9ACTN|nr:SsgA family sporulation/cell division regulator [Streptomyces canarius]GHA75810.1 sporulation-specific cell division protein SsgB [Streptomyces canarius]